MQELTSRQIEMLKKKFDKGYTLIQFCNDLELDKSNVGEWEEGALTEIIGGAEYLEYLASKEDFYIYRPDIEYIEDFLKKVKYEPDLIEDIDWSDRKTIAKLLKYLKDYGLIFRLKEELKMLGED